MNTEDEVIIKVDGPDGEDTESSASAKKQTADKNVKFKFLQHITWKNITPTTGLFAADESLGDLSLFSSEIYKEYTRMLLLFREVDCSCHLEV